MHPTLSSKAETAQRQNVPIHGVS